MQRLRVRIVMDKLKLVQRVIDCYIVRWIAWRFEVLQAAGYHQEFGGEYLYQSGHYIQEMIWIYLK
jgi:hypothetical protein